jgi:hypothetical protein
VVRVDDLGGEERVVLGGGEHHGAMAVDLPALAEEGEDAVRGPEPAPPVRVHAPPLPLFV